MTTDAQPFPAHPSFARRADYARWYMQTFKECPVWAHAAAAGDPQTYLEAVAQLKEGKQ